MVPVFLFAVLLQLESATPRAFDDRHLRFDGPILLAQAIPPATVPTPTPSSQTPVPAQSGSPGSSTQSASPPKKPSTSPTGTHKKKHKASAPSAHNVVVKNGSTSDPSIRFSTPVSPEQAAREKQDTAGLLATADANLQGSSGRQLNPSQQDTSAQVRSYIQQAKTAEESGDLQGAHNLALKALLLSKELVQK